ncbi:MAG: M42 family metallopeptidase [Fervidicoccaceae archaeon]
MSGTSLGELFADLKRLSEIGGPSGYEDEVREAIVELLKDHADELYVDALGNVVAIKRGTGKRRLMLAAHMDEIGLMVRHIDDNGFIFFSPIGGWNERILPGTRVKVRTLDGRWIPGVVGSKPPHLMKEEERKQVVEIEKLYIDVGARSRSDAESLGIAKGSIVVVDAPVERLAGTRVTGKAFDDRAGLVVLARVFREIEPREVDVVAVATVQEEVGLKGARTSAFWVEPHVALAVDVTAANDLPGVEPQDAVAKLGQGPAIKIMDGRAGSGLISNPKLVELLRKTAKERGIPHQPEVLPGGTTDATAIQLNREGVPATTVSIPTRYIHSPVEVLDLEDLVNAIELVKAFYENLTIDLIDRIRGYRIK